MRYLTSVLTVVLLVVFSGCASMDKRKKCIATGAAVGAAIGSGTGAVIGHQGDTDNAAEGSVIGAVVGGIIGGAVGCFYCKAANDEDHDGVYDDKDKCPGTPEGVKVDPDGCALDSDGDGVPDYKDKCPGTGMNVKVDIDGCPVDSDGDGVADCKDKCPDTPKGIKVDSSGCPLDSDGDGVYDYLDKCPNTPRGATVNMQGCWAFEGNVLFEVDKWDIRPEAYSTLDKAVKILKDNPDMRVEIQGHTDSTGSQKYNQVLSEKRAEAVKAYLVKEGIDPARLETKGYGESVPVASNDTAEGRQNNRRVQFQWLP